MSAEPLQKRSTVQPVSLEELPELLSLAAACAEAPGWPSNAWRSFVLPYDGGGAMQRVVFGARTPGGILCGLIAVTLIDEVTELEMLLVHPAWRLKGVGRSLVEHWLQWAQNGDVQEALLEVRASNTGAQRLYRSFGFAEEGTRRDYYQHPMEDAVLMRKLFIAAGVGVG